MGLDGLVSKHKDRPYRAGRSPHWVKVKNLKPSRPGTGEGFAPDRRRLGTETLDRESAYNGAGRVGG